MNYIEKSKRIPVKLNCWNSINKRRTKLWNRLEISFSILKCFFNLFIVFFFHLQFILKTEYKDADLERIFNGFREQLNQLLDKSGSILEKMMISYSECQQSQDNSIEKSFEKLENRMDQNELLDLHQKVVAKVLILIFFSSSRNIEKKVMIYLQRFLFIFRRIRKSFARFKAKI